MPVLRHQFKCNFTIIPNDLLRDAGLSLRDVGLLCLILSLPESWEFSIRGLVSIMSHDGRDAVAKSLNAIEKAGYLRREKVHDKSGKIQWIWWVSDMPLDVPSAALTPCPDSSDTVVLGTVSPCAVNPSERKNSSSKHPKENKGAATQRFVPPDESEVAEYAKEHKLCLDAGAFIDYYMSKGWKVGLSPMKDWKAAVRNWVRRSNSTVQQNSAATDGLQDFELVEIGGVKRWQKRG